jgi:hypothetical protein
MFERSFNGLSAVTSHCYDYNLDAEMFHYHTCTLGHNKSNLLLLIMLTTTPHVYTVVITFPLHGMVLVPNRGGVISYCIDRPSLVLGLVLRDKMHVVVPGRNCMGLPVVSAESKRCMGGVQGTKDNAVVVSRASTKGAPRDRGAASWERLHPLTTVAEVCMDRGREASRSCT